MLLRVNSQEICSYSSDRDYIRWDTLMTKEKLQPLEISVKLETC